MDLFLNKFNEYAEIAFYFIFTSVLLLITAVPIFTIGAAITSTCKIYLLLPQHDYSMSVRKITQEYLKYFLKRLAPTSLTTAWLLITGYTVYKSISFVNGNIFLISLIFLVVFELILFFQMIFIVFADFEKLMYFDAILNTFVIVHKHLLNILPIIVLQAAFIFITLVFPWTLIIIPGLSLFISVKIYSSKIKPSLSQLIIIKN
jgi:hypothetical protein